MHQALSPSARLSRQLTLSLLLLTSAAGAAPAWAEPQPPATRPQPIQPDRVDESWAELTRLRSQGVAHLENGELAAATLALRRASGLSGQDPFDRLNLGLALLAQGELEAAQSELRAAAAAQPRWGAPHYALGVLALRRGTPAPARSAFQAALERAPTDCGVLYNLGAVEEQLGAKEAAARRYQQLMKLGWSLGGRHFLAGLYRHARLQLAQGRRAEAERELKLYQEYFRRVGKPGGEPDLQSGPLLWPLHPPSGGPWRGDAPRGREPTEIALRRLPPEATGLHAPPAPPVGGAASSPGVALADLDGDGLPEVLWWGPAGVRTYRNSGRARFELQTGAGAPAALVRTPTLDVAVADPDNDGDQDLLVVGEGTLTLLRNRGDASFERAEGGPPLGPSEGVVAARWVDVDQEGDLDLLLLGGSGASRDAPPARDRLLLNRGDGTYVEQRGIPGLTEGRARSSDALAADLDDDGDTDLVVARPGLWPFVFSNQREGRYREIGRQAGLADGHSVISVALIDADADGRWDLVSLGSAGLRLHLDPLASGPGAPAPITVSAAQASALVVVDLDQDGHEDLLVGGPGPGLRVLRGGAGPAFVRAPGGWETHALVTGMAAGDIDRDGAPDVVVATAAGPELWQNRTEALGAVVRLRLHGRKNNRAGAGSLVELRAGTFYARRQVGSEPLLIGLGHRRGLDTLRIRWPNGLFQNVVRPAVGGELRVQEVQELAGSCPFLYTWDGEGWRFVSDFLGGGGLGLPAGPGTYLPPDSDEHLLIEGEQLVADGAGRLRLQLTEELREEQLYLDSLRLLVLDHPVGTRVVPDERFTIPGPTGDRRFAYRVADSRPPLSVLDDFGGERVEELRERDGDMVGAFILAPEQFRGLVEPHSYVMDLGDTRQVRTLWLMMTGWVFWGGGSTGLAAMQHPGRAFGPVALDVQDEQGSWQQAVADIGFPSGKTKIMPVDLSAVVAPRERLLVRLRTALRLHWDQIEVIRDPGPVEVREHRLAPLGARLYSRGFSRRVDDDLERPERFVFDDPVPPEAARFNQASGTLTRLGDVLPLLAGVDDLLVVMSAGDALEVTFDGTEAPSLPAGWRRDYLLRSVGWNKDGDPAVGAGQTVGPLPYHGMPRYPYGPDAARPLTPAYSEYLQRWQTRPARSWVPALSESGSPASP